MNFSQPKCAKQDLPLFSRVLKKVSDSFCAVIQLNLALNLQTCEIEHASRDLALMGC